MKHAQCNVLIFNLLIVNKVIAKVVRKENKVEMIVIWWKAFGGSHLVEVEKTERATPVSFLSKDRPLAENLHKRIDCVVRIGGRF